MMDLQIGGLNVINKKNMKKILFLIVMVFCLVSCNEMVKDEPIPNKKEEEQWAEITCPKCNGYGQVEVSTTTRVVVGLITLGPGFLCDDMEPCGCCHGTGVVRERLLIKR